MAAKITHWSVFCDIPATLGSAMWVVFTHRLINVNQTKQILYNKTENKTVFNGTFDANCQSNYVPDKLQALVSMSLEGPNIEKQSKTQNKSACLTIAQLIYFNSVQYNRKSKQVDNTHTLRHKRDKETTFPIYLSLLFHSHTRKKELIDTFHSYGIGITYYRLLQISTDLANTMCSYYKEHQVVCPPKLKSGVFTTGAVDNIDHNPSFRSIKDSFHGTAIFLTQHPTCTWK